MPGTGEFPEQSLISVYLCDFPLCGHRWNVLALPRNQLGSLSVLRPEGCGTEPRLAVLWCLHKGVIIKTKEVLSFPNNGLWCEMPCPWRVSLVGVCPWKEHSGRRCSEEALASVQEELEAFSLPCRRESEWWPGRMF